MKSTDRTTPGDATAFRTATGPLSVEAGRRAEEPTRIPDSMIPASSPTRDPTARPSVRALSADPPAPGRSSHSPQRPTRVDRAHHRLAAKAFAESPIHRPARYRRERLPARLHRCRFHYSTVCTRPSSRPAHRRTHHIRQHWPQDDHASPGRHISRHSEVASI
jgi:hypothetical protein